MPFDTMKRLVKKENVPIDDIKGKEFIIQKAISFGDVAAASRINRYMWFIDPRLVAGMLIVEMQKFPAIPRWIRKDKRKNDDIDKLIVEYVKRFEFDPKILQFCYPQLRKTVEGNLKQFLQEMGANEKMFKKHGIELTKPAPQSALDQWF